MPEFRLQIKTNQTETETVPKSSLPNHEKIWWESGETGRSQTQQKSQQATENPKDSGKGTAERAFITGHSSYALSILLTKQNKFTDEKVKLIYIGQVIQAQNSIYILLQRNEKFTQSNFLLLLN